MTTEPSRARMPGGAAGVVAALVALALLGAACGPAGGRAAGGGVPDIHQLPHSELGVLLFSPPDNATDVDPTQPVLVQSTFSDAHITHVDLIRSGGESIAGTLTADGFAALRALQPDSTYTVTATASLPPGSASPGATTEQTETVTFSTTKTPKVVSVSPTVVGPGQPAVVTFDRAAGSVKVDGPFTSQLGPGGMSLTLYPQDYRQGAAFSVSLTATSPGGTPGSPQSARFVAKGGPTASVSISGGATNVGVGLPLTVTLSEPPSNPADFAGHFSVTADVTASVVPPALVPTFVSGTVAANPCSGYSPPPAAGLLVASTSWVTPTRLQLSPRTADGDWPANATINLSAQIDGLAGQDGSWFTGSLSRSFATGDKRVIDVDLSTQTLTACRNGVMANQFPVSTGIPGKETHTGTFSIYERITDAEMKSSAGEFAPDYYDVKHVPWTQYFHNGEALHGAWWHNNFGHPMSHGCVNVSTPTRNASWPHAAPNAEYLWNFDTLGDPVVVHGKTPA